MLKVKNLVFMCISLYVCIILGVNSALALDIPKIGDKIELTKCELSESYLEWTKLSEEDKQKTIMPPMCKVDNVRKFNKKSNLFSIGVGDLELPDSYDARQQSYISEVKNQEQTNGCWAFSSTTLLEYYANKVLNVNSVFSTRHMVYSTTRDFFEDNQINEYGYNKVLTDGGNFFMSSNYYINSQGPILESSMNFENNEDKININQIQNKKTELDVNDIVLEYDNVEKEACTAYENNTIKEYIYKYGSVAITTYITDEENYYNSDTSSFYYNGTEDSNHAVLIVGWNDSYSKDNFSSSNKPKSDGAWIVQNSYGSSFGDNGYYYISYEDIHVCDIYMAIKNADKTVHDNSYIHDTLGFNILMGYEYGDIKYTTAYAMNVFTKEEKKEKLKEVTFGSAGLGSYKIYYMKGNGKDSSITSMEEIGSGRLEHSGYVTHILENPILLEEDITEFSIVVYYEMDSVTKPIRVSGIDDKFYKYVSIDKNKSFTSLDGTTWKDLLQEPQDPQAQPKPLIASIKVFTDDVIYDQEILTLYDELKSIAKNYIEKNTINDEVYFEFKDGIINKVDKFGNAEPVSTINASGSGEMRINLQEQISIVIYDENKNIKNDYGSDKLYDEPLNYSRENVELFKNLHRLELVAEEYVKEKSLNKNTDWLVFFYIRQFKYGKDLTNAKDQYNIVTGVDANFVTYVNDNASNLENYFESKDEYTINEHKIDLKHMAASLAGLLHATDALALMAYTEKEYNCVVSWAGDLHTLMEESILKNGVKEQYGNYKSATKQLMGTGMFGMEDVYADIDAWLLYYNIKENTNLDLFEIFNKFYTGISNRSYKNRFTSFLEVMNAEASKGTPKYDNFESLVNHFTNIEQKPYIGWKTIGTLEVKPSDEEEAEIAAGFVEWINEQAEKESMKPDEPDEPIEPDEPDEPDEPIEPDEPDEPIEPDEPKIITSDVYKIDQDKLLIYTQPNTSINTFISNVTGITDGSVSYEGNIYTGLKVDGYTIIIYGDVNGDGEVDIADLAKISHYIVNDEKKFLLDSFPNYKIAANAKVNEEVDIADLNYIYREIFKPYFIVEGGEQ